MDVDWGDELDGDEADLYDAATQAEAGQPAGTASEADLLAMTALLQDDDFDELLEPRASTPPPETDRLNQSVAVFAGRTQAGPPSPTVDKTREELARAHRLQHKAQGEASWLRKEKERREREHNKEMKRYQDLLLNLEQKLKEEKKKTEDIEQKGKNQIFFLNQEKEQMKLRLEKLEEESKARSVKKEAKSSAVPAPLPVKVEKSPAKTADTKVEPRPDRRRLVLKMDKKTELVVKAFTETSEASAECKCSLLLQTDQSDLQAALTENTNLLTESVMGKLPVVVMEDLLTLESLLESFSHLLSSSDLGLVTECCSRVLQNIIRSQDCRALQPCLSIILLAWTPRLLTPDITGDILTLVSQVVDLLEDVSRPVLRLVFSVLCLVTGDSDHCRELCSQQSEDCPLRQILSALAELAEDSRAAACEVLLDWLQFSTSLSSHRPGWTDNSCPGCTSETIKTLMSLLETQVYMVVSNPRSLEKVRSH